MTGPEVILPPAQISWLLAQPEHSLDQKIVIRKFLEVHYTLFGPTSEMHTTVQKHILRRDLPRELDALTPELTDGVMSALDVEIGTSYDEWKEVAIFDVATLIFSRMVNRVYVGKELNKWPNLLRKSKCTKGYQRSCRQQVLSIRQSYVRSYHRTQCRLHQLIARHAKAVSCELICFYCYC